MKLLHILRSYSAVAVVISSALLVSATNVASLKGGRGLIFGRGENAKLAQSNALRTSAQASKTHDLSMVPLAQANGVIDPQAADEEETQLLAQGQGLMSAAIVASGASRDPEEDGGVKMYTVQMGDTISSIAAKHKITVNTVLWANDIENVDEIMPGDTIFILPVSGIQHTVKSGDTIENIAAKYKADRDKIIAFNDLPANGALENGATIVIPDGRGQDPQPAKPKEDGLLDKRQYATSSGGAPEVSGGRKLDGKAGTGHRFPYGYCTWYVAQKRYVPWGGNAGTWLYNAKAQGYQTGKAPRAGAIVVTTENRYYGHVALVEKVSGDTITVSEMNYTGWGKTSRRTINIKSRVIKGYIY
ncbi:MAG TPA: LysM peptidoglycan-binding domain-containing protein [Candidatus Moranbacteria bacterium]|nr:LysM peptidoglycan-binding domain-containing protein [Candidatus Moranbacteria bacterium]